MGRFLVRMATEITIAGASGLEGGGQRGKAVGVEKGRWMERVKGRSIRESRRKREQKRYLKAEDTD